MHQFNNNPEIGISSELHFPNQMHLNITRFENPSFQTQQVHNDKSNMQWFNNPSNGVNNLFLQQVNDPSSMRNYEQERMNSYPYQNGIMNQEHLQHHQHHVNSNQVPTGQLNGNFGSMHHQVYPVQGSLSPIYSDSSLNSLYIPKNHIISPISIVDAPVHTKTPIEVNNSFSNAPSRTVYLGNISPIITVKELLDHVRSGVVDEVKILPEKMCAFISFVDESSALLFHSDAILKRLNIDGRDIKIGWGKPTVIDPIVASNIITDGATRNVFIGQLNTNPESSLNLNIDPHSDGITEEKLIVDLKVYGEIDCIKIVKEKGIAFIHFASILSAIKVVNNLANSNAFYQKKKIFYGKDRCAFITKTQQHNAAQFLGIQPGMAHMGQLSDREFISNALLQQSAAAAAIATSAGGPNNLGNRTVYLGNLPKDVKIEEICNTVRSGLLQNIKLLSDRYVCFVTFIDPTAAAQFYAMSSLHGLVLQKKRCKVGWGKHSGPLPNLIALAVSNGASRNVYVGNIDFESDSLKKVSVFTEENLRTLFQQYGEVEQINFLPAKNCCFVNYTSISNAISAIDKIKSNPHFKNLKINFGKDRCGNIPHQMH